MRIAFCGASGTGKTTLMTWLKQELPTYEINPVGSRSVAQDMGFNNPYDVDAAGLRAEFQDRLIKTKHAWEAPRASFLTDRTYADNVAYTILHEQTTLRDDHLALIRQGMSLYDLVIYTPYGAFQNLDNDPARVNRAAYHEIYDALAWGLLCKYPPKKVICLDTASLETRKIRLASTIGFYYAP